MIVISARLLVVMAWFGRFEPHSPIARHRSAGRTASRDPRRSEPMHHGIDFKNPFTMSKRVRVHPHHRAFARRTVSLHPWKILVSVSAPAAPSVAAKLRLVALFAALAVLGRMRRSFATSSLFLRDGGAYRDRTDDLMLAKQPLSQLS